MTSKRDCGILLHVASLPGNYGIGTMGIEAQKFINFLADARQSIWQILPLAPAGKGFSPYMSPSAFAGNPLLLDLDLMHKQGLITKEELSGAKVSNLDRIDYPTLSAQRDILFRNAYARSGGIPEIPATEAYWLGDYALFMAAKSHFGGIEFYNWPDKALMHREPAAVKKYSMLLAEEIGYHVFLQLQFFQQWEALRAYANAKGVSICGDLPFYLSPDSDAVWVHPELFQLNNDYQPKQVAGVPPDAFSEVGQLWGNPLYRWSAHRKDKFAWWRQRFNHLSRLYDILRIDHFRAIHTYWSVPANEKDARAGHWRKGPGMPFVRALKQSPLRLIAEDLGDLDDDVRAFVAKSGLPNMKVLVQAFEGGESIFLPHNCGGNCVLYTSTHDTPTFMEWFETLGPQGSIDYARHYMKLNDYEGVSWGALRTAWSSAAPTVITSFQDVLGLGHDARMNVPGTQGAHNWSWRVRAEALNSSVATPLRDLTELYSRAR